MIKAIFFDIDGTLVSFQTHTISNSTIKALQKAHNNGIKLFIATGRAKALINNLGKEIPFDGYITVNGCHCYTSTGETIHKEYIPKVDLNSLSVFQKESSIPFFYVCDEETFITNINENVERLCHHLALSYPPIAPPEHALNKNVIQLMGFFEAEEEVIMQKILPHCSAQRWHPSFVDIVAKGNDKSTGIDHMLSHYGIKLDETMAFGDGGNDIPMLKHVALGVAMGNSEECVKNAADYTTSSVDEDGIAHALEHFNII